MNHEKLWVMVYENREEVKILTQKDWVQWVTIGQPVMVKYSKVTLLQETLNYPVLSWKNPLINLFVLIKILMIFDQKCINLGPKKGV